MELAGPGKLFGEVEGRCTASFYFKMYKSLKNGGPGSLISETRNLLRRFDIRVKKGLGQNFLVDEKVLEITLEAAGVKTGDTVIEVGPGLGVLTRELACRAGRVIAIELDGRLAAFLKEKLAEFDNLTILNEDVLETDIPSLVSGGGSYKVVANLPYYITSPVLRYFLEAPLKPETMIVMVQKEVAQAIAAGSGQRSLLSIGIQYFGEPRIIDYVPAASFYPAPAVDSALLRIDVYPKPAVAVADEASFFRLVRAGFTASRKQMVNSLKQGLGISKAEASAWLEEAGINASRRAETLSLEEWAKLWNVFYRERENG